MRLLLVGAANPETIRMVGAVTRASPELTVAGLLDNEPVKRGSSVHGYTVMGGTELVDNLAADDRHDDAIP